MRAYRRFTVQPVLPEKIHSLEALAHNLRWSWHQPSRDLFRAIDPQLWDSVGEDPVKLLTAVSAERMQQLAADKVFVRRVELLHDDLQNYLTADLWFQNHAAKGEDVPSAIGYFSAEFGVSQTLPQYSGGLGILAGDHLKAASDLGLPLVGIGLLYRHGYFRQSLNAAGWQQERYPVLSSNDLPVRRLTDDAGEPLTITVDVSGREVKAWIWVASVGRIPLLMLDTDRVDNDPEARNITDRLYGGGTEHRLAQEVLLGIGGVRALREYCRVTGHAKPDVYHCNEGHAGFLGFERIREYLAEGHDLNCAIELTRAGTVFTTHTPVPAGIDRFDRSLIERQFAHFCSGLPLQRILDFGTETYAGGDHSRFNMAVLGLRLGQRANGVSKLHGAVSREMFNGLWPDFDETEVPITSVTNGVHHRTWIHPELLEILEAHTDDSDTVIDGYDWSAIQRVDDDTLWSLKRQLRASMIHMARARLSESCKVRGLPDDWTADALNPRVLTLGFARRGASYKRLTLMLTDPERLKRLLNHPQTPIQIIIAGKAHPADNIGKSLIQQMVQFSDQPDVRGKLVFLPDYDMSMARPLYPGCDVWVNNPLRPYEACGTSGMKASLNGAANLSIKDGWWDELYAPEFGWEIPSLEGITDQVERDAAEAEYFYSIIENEIIPKFYTLDTHGNPLAWLKMMRDTISDLGPEVLASRMVRDYVTQMYAPAALSSAALVDDSQANALAVWKERIRRDWDSLHVVALDTNVTGRVAAGDQLEVTVDVRLGDLSASDVAVQLIFGDVDNEDKLHNIRKYATTPALEADGVTRFEASIPARYSGQIGLLARAVPSHPLLASDSEMGLAAVVTG
ncbi:alpha-glucan family phosphorylase [Tessaracoccus antarcticus]|uniref:glycogen phosphorylase n=1 Tax=Tessaracoccus antarcticus TaxID=2479848 RepID=A0A3M0G419_9ACTN|nr:alpha-glucan family phosphorylase [Tessaracoccus antarcticus]RMB58817.1 alpha-glucan family phosphorylase [Tessaracoccus antarcticus]